MATAAVARPAQTLRTRRDPPRPNLQTKRTSVAIDGANTGLGVGAGAEPANKKRRMDRPYVLTDDFILRKFRGKPPSLELHLHPTHFEFEGQDEKYRYDSAMRVFLERLRKQQVPHELLEELLASNVPFYDGCLIVEVHNHRSASTKDKARRESDRDGGQTKYSMHNYNSYVTPSGLVPYPKKAQENELAKQTEPDLEEQDKIDESKDKGKSKDNNGPHISTIVMHPTQMSHWSAISLLANTPASEMKGIGADGSMPSTTQTPQQEQKMCLEDGDFYQFQADLLLKTEPTLFLEPARNPQEADNALKLLQHPLHSEPPPSPRTRKRTTAEMAADDAQAAESERRMLIMDECTKPTVPGASDTAGAAQGLGFSRFKTIQMVREKHEEQERQKKEEEAQAAFQRRQQEEADKAARETQLAKAEKQRQMLTQRQNLARQQHQEQQMRNQQMAQAMAQAQNQNHIHSQQNNWNQQQGNFQNSASMPQASPVVRQQTPMINNSSPMLPQNGFPMTTTSSQGAGSPPRPTSAAMPNPSVAMARQVSQQQHGSRNATPQMSQGTPHMAGAMPNRQMTQTPRMPQSSPAPGTPAAVNMQNMPMQTSSAGGMTSEQIALLQARQQQMQNHAGGMNGGSPNPNLTPEQIQAITQQQRVRQQMMVAAQQGNMPHLAHQRQVMMMRQQQQQQQQQQQMMQQRMLQQQNSNASQNGSPHPGVQSTPQMGHAHPQQGGGGGGEMKQGQQMTPQQAARQHQQQMQLRNVQLQLTSLAQQFGGSNNIPQHIVQSLPPAAQPVLHQQHQRQQAFRAQQMAMRAQQAQNSGQPVAGSSSSDPEYMQALHTQRARLAAQQQAQQAGQGGQGNQMGGMSMTHNVNFNNMQNQQQQFGNHGGGNLSAEFQAAQQALNMNQGGGMGQ